MKEANFYNQKKEKIECRLCSHFCLIAPNRVGKCGTRLNKNQKLWALNFGFPAALNNDPIEKKPLFHFLPGTQTYSIGTLGCNFKCDNCQNWEISQADKIAKQIETMDFVDPARIVENAIADGCDSISFTYNEPTIFIEYALEIMKIAHQNDLKNIWVTNAYMSTEALEMIIPYLDATNVDLKSFDSAFYRDSCGSKLQPVLNNLKKIKEAQVHLEVTTLIIPSLTNDRDMITELSDYIVRELDSDTPWHITKFSPQSSWKLQDLSPTGEDAIYEAYEIGKNSGLKYVYVGNIPGDQKENTYCPQCGELAIRRLGHHLERFDISGRCAFCDKNLDIME